MSRTGSPTSIIELSLSARHLSDMDVFSKSDPMIVIYNKPYGSKTWSLHSQTEILFNTLNPDFVKKICLSYFFEEIQPLRFEVYDMDSEETWNLSKQDFIGEAECHLSSIVSNSQGLILPLRRSSSEKTSLTGTLILRSEETSFSKDKIGLAFVGREIKRMSFFMNSNPFLEFARSSESGDFIVCHRTEVIKRNCNPNWSPFVIPIRRLCNGDLHRCLRITCWNFSSNGNHVLIGEFFVTAQELLESSPNTTFPIIHPSKVKRSSKNNHGSIELKSSSLIPGISFLDYIKGGTELCCSISIDFTASNGDPNISSSLHYISASKINYYETALITVGEIIAEYDSDKFFPLLGFGAQVPPDWNVSHCFYVNGHENNPHCAGIEGCLEAYRSCIRRVRLFGPTNFAPTISHVEEIARNFKDGSQYFILLILTDGIITDMPQTKAAIVKASLTPMSIIIIGLGTADFSNMEELDGDNVRVSHNGRFASRDIVQFVSFSKYSFESRHHFAADVLAEIPKQFTSYMTSHGLKPLKKNP